MPIGLGHARKSKSSPEFQEFQDRLEDEMIAGGAYQPEVCARCDLNGSRLCTRNGCDMTAQDAIVYLNGGRQPDPPKVQNGHGDDLMDAGCRLSEAQNDCMDTAQRWLEQRGA